MKKIYSLLFVTAFFSFVWHNTKHETPEEWELESIDGTLTSVYEMVDDLDRADDQYVVLEIFKNGITRSIVSLDKSLLSTLRINMELEAKIATRKNASELWVLNNNGHIIVSFDDTKEIKWQLTKTKNFMLGMFYIVFICSILFTDNSRSNKHAY